MAVLENCEPKRVFHYFEEICKIPHGSGNTKQISDYLVQFAKDHDLKYVQDEMNNVVIYKPGTAGYENAPVVIIQGHMDMVCEKRPDVEHDFTKDGLNLSVEGDYVSANGTTLGGDDGIAVAYGLALLESDTIAHPPLEVFITVDEEIGLLGAVGFDCSVLKGRRFINLDSEAEGSLWISCAGGLSGVSHIPVTRLDAEGEKLTVKISGLMGGHSGAEIDKNRANANSLLGKFLHGLDEKTDFELISVQGGQKDNAITREATAEILVLEENADAVREYAASVQGAWREEYAGTDEGITVTVEDEGKQEVRVLHPTSKEKVIFFLVNVPYGGEYERQGVYPAWEYRKDSPLRDKMVEVYEEMYGQKPNVVAIHAGLECGLFYKKMEGLDCVSLGPDMKDIHTSEEVLSISSTERVWKYLVKVLEALKE